MSAGFTTDQALRLFLDHCKTGDRGTLELYGQQAAVAAMMSIVPDLYEALERAIYLIEDAEKDTSWCAGDPYSGAGPVKDFTALLAKVRDEA